MFPKVLIDCSNEKHISLLLDGKEIPGAVRIDNISNGSHNECREITITIVASELKKKDLNGRIEDFPYGLSKLENFKNDFQIFNEKIKKLESDIETKDCQIEEMQHHIDCLKAKLAEAQDNKFELSSEPIKVAEMLIYAKYSYKNRFTGMQHRGSFYQKSDLRQIAEHLLVYCNNSEDE